MKRVAVVGAGKLGSCLAAVFAGNKMHTTVYDVDENVVAALDEGRAPVVETRLQELLELGQPWLRASTNMDVVVEQTDIAFVVVPTPSDTTGQFSNFHVHEAVAAIGRSLRKTDKPWYTVVIVSTVMPGSTRGSISRTLEESSGRAVSINVGLAYCPAFIALGSVIHDFTHPDLVLIGADDPVSQRDVRGVLADIVKSDPAWVGLFSIDAEIAKISLNVGLVTKIAYTNTISELCERIDGADARAVLTAVGFDSRIGSKYLAVGGPAGGPCLPRDAVAWMSLATELDMDAPLIKAIHEVGEHQALRIAGRLIERKRVAVLGTTYKPDTPVTDASLGLRIADILTEWEVTVETYDPAAMMPSPTWAGTVQELVEWADAVVVATAWPEFAGIDYGGIKLVIDVWGILPPEENIERIGVGP